MKIPQIIIKHTLSAKAYKHEYFDITKTETITIGRDDKATIRFASDKENGVSRMHAMITVGSIAGQFYIKDLNSLNGVFVNGIKIRSKKEIFAEDEIQLGFKGPIFSFNLNPRPSYPKASNLIIVPATEKTKTSEQLKKYSTTLGIGKETFTRATLTERKRCTQTLVNVLVATACLCLILGFTFKDRIFMSETIIQNKVVETEKWRPE